MLALLGMDYTTFMVCTVLCLVYILTNLLLQNQFLDKKLFGKGIIRELLLMNGYALFMSTPLMPFVYGGMQLPGMPFYLFALSNLVWQLVYVRFCLQKDHSKVLFVLSLTNLIALLLTNYINAGFSSNIVRLFS